MKKAFITALLIFTLTGCGGEQYILRDEVIVSNSEEKTVVNTYEGKIFKSDSGNVLCYITSNMQDCLNFIDRFDYDKYTILSCSTNAISADYFYIFYKLNTN